MNYEDKYIKKIVHKITNKYCYKYKLEKEKTDSKFEIESKYFIFISENTNIETLKRLNNYISNYCPRYDIKTVILLIEKGQKLVKKIQKKENIYIPLEECSKNVSCIVWYIMFCAICKNQEFCEGMFVIKDPGHIIVKFLLSLQTIVYSRLSSHFKNRILSINNNSLCNITYGIDIVQDYKNGLPGNNKTINFAPIKSLDECDWTFIKPEKWGLNNISQFLFHSIDYVITRSYNLLANTTCPNDRKEHIPLDVLEKKMNILPKIINNNIETYGIASIIKHIKDDHENTNFINYLEKEKKYDYLEIRKGDEIILGQSFIEN